MMFDLITRPAGPATTRWTSAAVSAAAHITVLIAIAVTALYATNTLPESREVMAFVVSAPVPPPPPAPPPPATRATAPKKVARAVATDKPQVATPSPVAAPVEAPRGISLETGLEGMSSSSGAVEAGFEGGISGGVVGGVAGGFEGSPPPPPPALPRSTAPVRVGGEITAPRVIRRVDPEYPPIAQAAQISGLVILEATVNREGSVAEIRVLRSHSFLEDAAVNAVKQWTYEPLMLNGQPQSFVITVTLSFTVPAVTRRAR